MTARFGYRAPRQREELLSLLEEYGTQAKVLAGGTDLLGDVRSGLVRPEVIVDVKKVAGYTDMVWSAQDGLIIPPAVTINDVLFSARVRESYPLLTACARDLASHQIRNRATVIGNVANASPCADMSPALLCLRATLVLSSREGSRHVPVSEFFTGAKRTALTAGEYIERIVIPPDTADARGSYRKLKRIKGHDLGIVGVAAMSKDGELRLGISSCAATPLLVEGLSVQDSADDVVAAAHEIISPISDVRCSKEYREHMVGVYVRRALREVA